MVYTCVMGRIAGVLGELVEYLRVGSDQCLSNTVEILCSRLVLVLQFCFYVQHILMKT